MKPRRLIDPSLLGAGLAIGLGLGGLPDSISRVSAQEPPRPPDARAGRGVDRPPPPPPRGDEADGDRPPPPPGRPLPPPPDRLLRALDRDDDGRLSVDEIKGAVEALKGLDDDKDGTLSEDELRPPRRARTGDRPPNPDEGPPADAPRPRRGGRPEGPPPVPAAGEQKIPLEIRGGLETDPRDRGRPVALVAGALGVSPEVFRDAFSRVRPAPAGTEPHPDLARQNKAVLLAALSPLGITNDQIDRASNYYRYNRGRNETWPARAAVGHAILKDGVVSSVVITDPGSGYNSPPSVSAAGHPGLVFEAKLSFGRDLKKNGSVASIAPAPADAASR